MLKHLFTTMAAAGLIAGLSPAHAGLLTSPIGLKIAMEASGALTKADLADPQDACMLRGGSGLSGPITLERLDAE
ncbi:hypothetical protein [Bradyrhizobium sp. HKCCYLS20291]|uniref:hypothetical protein n=1 Tax=Bradyrhizobium sp. HKCCYLS20291 TaxID=3420766 RepID=UPI003EB872D3